MRKQWLARAGGAQLTLVFGGWGLGAAPFAGLGGAGDILYVDDYRELAETLAETTQYDRTRLLAYSFGVASAVHWLQAFGLSPDLLVAVNGTVFPADPTRGIDPAVIAATADGLSRASFARFCRRAGHQGAAPDIDLPSAQAELRAIVARGPAPEIAFDRIWISEGDRIVPPQAQATAWSAQSTAIRHIQAPHQPFRQGQDWDGWFA